MPNKNPSAQALRAIPSDKRSAASRENGKKGGRPPKRYCGMCDKRVAKRECPLCGADTERWPD